MRVTFQELLSFRLRRKGDHFKLYYRDSKKICKIMVHDLGGLIQGCSGVFIGASYNAINNKMSIF